MIRIAFLGYGTVGQAFAEVLLSQTRIPVKIQAGLVRDPGRTRKGPPIRLTTVPEAVLDAPDVDVIVDVMGGRHPALPWVRRAISHGKSVISANKELIASHGPELSALAADHGVFLAYEAAVGGGMPILETLKTHFSGAPVTRFLGILNGTTNYILSRLEAGEEFSAALANAQEHGYAEPDASNDLDGTDIARKLAIAFGLLFGPPANFEIAPRGGVQSDLGFVIKRVRTFGWRLKVLAIAESQGGVQVWPTLVPKDHHLAGVQGVTNAVGVEVHGHWFWFEGPGAGGQATSLSLLADLYRGYDQRFRSGRLPELAGREVHPITMPWVGFGQDADRSPQTFSAPAGSIQQEQYWITPPMDQPRAAAWVAKNPGLLAYPAILKER